MRRYGAPLLQLAAVVKLLRTRTIGPSDPNPAPVTAARVDEASTFAMTGESPPVLEQPQHPLSALRQVMRLPSRIHAIA
jgi:hypothetical protein